MIEISGHYQAQGSLLQLYTVKSNIEAGQKLLSLWSFDEA